jgi:hypothetical protein
MIRSIFKSKRARPSARLSPPPRSSRLTSENGHRVSAVLLESSVGKNEDADFGIVARDEDSQRIERVDLKVDDRGSAHEGRDGSRKAPLVGDGVDAESSSSA